MREIHKTRGGATSAHGHGYNTAILPQQMFQGHLFFHFICLLHFQYLPRMFFFHLTCFLLNFQYLFRNTRYHCLNKYFRVKFPSCVFFSFYKFVKLLIFVTNVFFHSTCFLLNFQYWLRSTRYHRRNKYFRVRFPSCVFFNLYIC